MSEKDDFEIIDESAVESVRRGRPSTVSPELVEALRNLKAGKVIVLKKYAGNVTAEDYGNHKQNVASSIRTAGTSAGVKVRIRWSPTGVPQVSVVTSKK